MEKSKWIVRGASLAIILGFFLPTVLVSCSGGLVDGGQSLSLANIAGQLDKALLYLLPVGFLIVLGLTILKPISQKEESNYLWGQLITGGIGILVTAVTLITLSNQLKQGSYGLLRSSRRLDFLSSSRELSRLQSAGRNNTRRWGNPREFNPSVCL